LAAYLPGLNGWRREKGGFRLGREYLSLAYVEEAIEVLEAGVDNDPWDIEAWHNLVFYRSLMEMKYGHP